MRSQSMTRLALSVALAIFATSYVLSAQQRGTAPPSAVRADATAGAAVPGDYIIGAEDVLGVVFWRETEMSGDVAVRPDGKITLPLIGDVVAAGRTTTALKEQIEASAKKFLTDANVTVVVRQLNSRKVFVTGEVRNPAAYQLTGPRNVMQVIAMAGGLNEYAESEEISVIRTDAKGQTRTFKFNYKDVTKGKKPEQNILLQPGDTIVVP